MKNLTNYWKINNDFEKMMEQAELMYQQASAYNNPVYQVMAKKFISEALIFSGLTERALPELEQARTLLSKFNDQDSLTRSVKADLFITFSNYYDLKGMPREKLYYTKLAGEEIKKIPNEKYRKLSLYVYYSNLGLAYKEQGNIDSAQFYFQKSLASEKDYKRPDIDFTTLSALGATYLQQKNYRKALIFFKSAEKIDARKNHINLQNLYSNIITTYSTLNIADSARIYQAKKDSLDLAIVKSQNKSLNKLLVEDKKHSDSWYK